MQFFINPDIGTGQLVHLVITRYAGENPNGSLHDIAGICNKQGNVLGMMPHPERAVEALLGNEDGLRVFKSLLENGTVKTEES